MIQRRLESKFWGAKVLSAVLVFALLSNQIFYGTAVVLAASAPAVVEKLTSKTLAQWTLPKELGRVSYATKAGAPLSKGPVMLLIEDAHAVPTTQESIRKIIQQLQTRDGLKTVFFEGAEGRIDPLLFRSFADKKNLQNVFNQYRDRGELSGVTLAAVLNPTESVYEGVEEQPLYEEQVNAWLTADLGRAADEKKLAELKTTFLEAEIRHESLALHTLNEAERHFEESQNLETWLKTLNQTEARAKMTDLETRYPSIATVLREMKGPENAETTAEIRKALEALFVQITNTVKSSSIRELSEKRQDYLTEKMSAGAWGSALMVFARRNHIQTKPPVILKDSVQQYRLLERIRGHEFFDQLERFSAEIRASMIVTPADAKLEQMRIRIKLLEKLVRLELTRQEWEIFSSALALSSKDLSANLPDEIAELQKKVLTLDQELSAANSGFVRFYTLALKREEVFWQKIQAALESGTLELAAFVGGGFHTDGLRAKLKQAQIAHAVITPAMTIHPDEKDFYRHAMRGQVSWGDQLDSQGASLAPYKAFSRAAVLALAKQVKAHQLKLWQRAVKEAAVQQGQTKDLPGYLQLLLGESESSKIPESFMAQWQQTISQFIQQLKQTRISTAAAPTFNLKTLTATAPFANPLVQRTRYPTAWRTGSPAASYEVQRSEVRAQTWLDSQDLQHVRDLTVVSRQMEAGLHSGILDALRQLPNGEQLVRQVAQTTLTGGLGALMHDLFDAWGKNGIDVIGINPIYEKIKAQHYVTGTPGDMEFGKYLRQVLEPAGIDDFEISLNLSPEFATEAQHRNSRALSIIDHLDNNSGKVVTKTLKARVFQTKTAVAGTTLYYLDIFYKDGEKEISIFDEVYPDEPGKASLWRDVHIAAYNKASRGLVERLAAQGRIKPKRLQVNNEVFVSLPTGEDRHDINHTVFLPGLYRSHEVSYSLLELPPEWHDKVVRDGVIDFTNVIPLDPKLKVITGVGLKEHTPELQRNIFPGFIDKLDGYNANDVRSTNGVLFDKWQVALKRELIQQFKAQLSLLKPAIGDDTEDDRFFFEALRAQPVLLHEFQRRAEYINAASVGAFLIWLKEEQKQPRWLESTAAKGFGRSIDQAVQAVNAFIQAVNQGIKNQTAADDLDATLSALKEALMADPIVSNIRRQVPYKGPDKWLEILRGFTTNGIALADFKKNGPRVVLGGRVFDPGAQGTFDEIKSLIFQLGLEDQMTTIENYNNLDAEVIFQGMAGMVMLSDEFLEASATSMMKGVTNFAALIGVWGGAMPEIFEIVDVTSGRVINIFEDEVTHDQVLENLNNGVWKITNGWMVAYGDERSNQLGGGRRPAAQSLVEALQGLKKTYAEAESRRALQFDVLASSWRVNMVTGQARAHAYLWEKALKKAEDEERFFNELNETDDDLIKLLSVQGGGFNWKTAESAVAVQSASGLTGFLKGFEQLRYMEKNGAKVVYPSLVYHLTHRFAGDDGDIFNYILGHLFKEDLPSLQPLKTKLLVLEAAAKQTKNLHAKIKINLEALNLLSNLVRKRDAFLRSSEFTAQIIQRYIAGETKMSRVFANEAVLNDTANYLVHQAAPSELENFFEATAHHLAQGDHFVADVFHSAELRQRFADYLKSKTTPEDALDFSSKKTPVYAVQDPERAIFIGVDLGDFSYSPQRGGEQKVWVNVRNAGFYLRTHALEDQEVSRRSRFQVRDVLTDAIYTTQDLQTLENKGLAVGVPSNFIQVLVVESTPEERLPFLISNAARGQLTHGRESSTLISEELSRLVKNPGRLREVLTSLSELSPEAAREKFIDSETQSNAVPAVMAMIGFFAPDLLVKTQAWDSEAYQKLAAIYHKSGLQEVLAEGLVKLHDSDPDTAVVISKTLGRRKLVLPIQFSKFRFSEDDGKVWIRLDSDDVGIIDDGSVFYTVRDYSIGVAGTEYGVHSGRELSEKGWHVGIPVVPGKLDRKGLAQHGWQFQVLELDQTQTARDAHHRRIDGLVGANLNVPQIQGQKFFINLTDLGAEEVNGEIVFKDGLKKGERLLEKLLKLGVGEVYLGGGLYPESGTALGVHQVPNAQQHFIRSGKSTVRVVNYRTHRVESGELTLAHNQGNPFSVGGAAGMLEINPKLAADGNARAALQHFTERAHALGIKVRVDFIPWRSPDSIDETNYQQTFYRELTEAERVVYERKKDEGDQQAYLDSIIATDGTIFYTSIPVEGQEKIIFVKHVWGYGAANADQAMINSLAKETQDYLIASLKARVDDGEDSVRVDLAFQLLKNHVGHYLNGLSQETVQRWAEQIQNAEEPLARIIREVRSYAELQGKTLQLNAEAYDDSDRQALLALGFDSVYYANPFEDYAGLVFDHKPAHHLASSVEYALKNPGKVVVYGSNFDQTSLRRIGGPRKGFTMLLNLLSYLGVDVLWTLRDALGHLGDVAPIPGGVSQGRTDRHYHEFVTLREIQVRTNLDRVAEELTQGPLARSLAEISHFLPAPKPIADRAEKDIQILDNQNTQQFISLAYRTAAGGWTVFVYSTRPENEAVVWIQTPQKADNESRKGYKALDVFDGTRAAKIEGGRLTGIHFERGDQYRIFNFGPQVRSEVREAVQQSVLNLARGQSIAPVTFDFLSALPPGRFETALGEIQTEAQRPSVVRLAYETSLSSRADMIEADFAADKPQFEALSENFISDSIRAVRDSAHDALLSDPTRELHFAMAFPLQMNSRIAEGLLDFAKMLQGLSAEYPGRVKAAMLLLADPSDLTHGDNQAYLKALRRTGVAKIVASDNSQLAVETERFLRDNPNALVWGAFEDLLNPGRKIHLVRNKEVSLKTALPFAFLLSRKLAEARFLTADVLKKVPESMQTNGGIAFNGNSLEVTRFALELVARMKARQLLDIAA